MKTFNQPPVSTLLPATARNLLVRAVEIDPHIPLGESVMRTRALEQTIARIKQQYPHYFKSN